MVTLKKLNIVNSTLLLLLFAMLAIVANDALIYKRAARQFSLAPPIADTAPKQVPIEEYASVVEEPVFPGKPARFTPATAMATPGASAVPADVTGILKKIRLTGTYVSGGFGKGGAESFALFNKVDDNRQKSFRIGDNVFGFGVLTRVTGGSVTVKAGKKEFLFNMPKNVQPAKYTPQIMPRVNKRAAAKSGPGAQQYAVRVSETEWAINQEAVLGAMNDMGSILSDARMTPVTANGKINGFRVSEIKPTGIFAAIGLENNDIIRRVNNYDMTSPERAIQVLSALKGERNFSIDIERGGKRISLYYNVR